MRLLFTIFAAVLIAVGLVAAGGMLLMRQYVPAASVFCSTVAFMALALIHDAIVQIEKLAAKYLPTMAADLSEVGEAHRIAKAQASHARREWEKQQHASIVNAPFQEPRTSRK